MIDLKKIKHVALDMDGTIYLGDTIFPFTLDFLSRLKQMGISYSFLTNNPSKSIDIYLKKLAGMGINATKAEIYNTTIATIDYIKAHYPQAKRLFLLGTPSMISQFEEAGFISCEDSADDEPDIVVAAFDMTLSYSRLCRVAWWISQKKPYLATNPDFVCPTNEKTVLVDCGSICRCLEGATGRKPDVTLGKPDPNMLLNIIKGKNLMPDEIIMVGDRLYTDIAMAFNANAVSCLVLSGETTKEQVAKVERQPDLILKNIEELGLLLEKAR